MSDDGEFVAPDCKNDDENLLGAVSWRAYDANLTWEESTWLAGPPERCIGLKDSFRQL